MTQSSPSSTSSLKLPNNISKSLLTDETTPRLLVALEVEKDGTDVLVLLWEICCRLSRSQTRLSEGKGEEEDLPVRQASEERALPPPPPPLPPPPPSPPPFTPPPLRPPHLLSYIISFLVPRASRGETPFEKQAWYVNQGFNIFKKSLLLFACT